MNSRFTYKCQECLAIFVVADPEGGRYPTVIPRSCGICGARAIELMGLIGPDSRVTLDTSRCKCDARCTHAAGPHCECQCGGENHQKEQEGWTVVTTDRGVITATCTDPATVVKHQTIASEYRDAIASAEHRRAHLWPHREFARREWIEDREAWSKAFFAAEAFAKARRSKNHQARLAKINSCFLPV